MKKIVILKNNGGRLANQLWLFSSVYAYCLEKKYICENRSFFRYYKYFNIENPSGMPGLLFYNKLGENKLMRLAYLIYSSVLKTINKSTVIDDKNSLFVLPPDKTTIKNQEDAIKMIDESNSRKFYFCGWLFRTPTGLEKYRSEIKEYFKPKKEYLDKVKNFIEPLKNGGKYLVGVHIRHGDYRKWNDGKFFYSFSEVRKILESHLEKQEKPENILYVLCSDEKIDDKSFKGLPYVKGLGSEIEDLYALASTNVIIGSNSSFGPWAAYYGNIPFIAFPEKK
ncbi:MAG: alpha-1,2-fucosyltransferase [Candidatus Paceibacterota bacterium]|jgi:hypothetical protein